MLGFTFGGLVKKLECAATDVSQDFVKSAGKEMGYLFDEKLYPLANKLDYIAHVRIEQIENLESQAKADIEFLLNSADEKVKHNIENINQIREATIRDLRETIGQTDAYLENRINQISLVVMKALNSAEEITQDALVEINRLEEKLFKDANQLIDKFIIKIDEVLKGNIESIKNELKKYLAHGVPNPFDQCRQRLKLGLKPGSMLSDIELYELSQCYELSKLNENTPVDQVLKIYGQLQHNATKMAALVRNAPELKRRAIQDWIKYGVLCDFWRSTISSYDSTDFLVLEPQKQIKLLTSKNAN